MRREDLLEQEYRKRMTQAAPDLWSRIEGNLTEHPERNEYPERGERPERNEHSERDERPERAEHPERDENAVGKKIVRFPMRRIYGAATAAAAGLVVLVLASGLLHWDVSKSSGELSGGGAPQQTYALTAAARPAKEDSDSAVSGALSGGGAEMDGALSEEAEIEDVLPEEAAGAPESDTGKVMAEGGPSPTMAMADGSETDRATVETAGYGTQSYFEEEKPAAGLQSASGAENGMSGSGQGMSGVTGQPGSSETGGVFANGVIEYDRLKLAAYSPLAIPDSAVTVEEDMRYFTEHALKDTRIFCQVTVKDVRFGSDQDGRLSRLVYETVVDEVYYTADGDGAPETDMRLPEGNMPETDAQTSPSDVEAGAVLTFTSPIIASDGDAGHSLYQLQPGGVYLLPLTVRNGGWEMVFPYAPQIQKTDDGKYLFHSGYYHLVTGGTAIVLGSQEGPNDYYYDRMFLREDDNFLSDLVNLIESQAEGRNET